MGLLYPTSKEFFERLLCDSDIQKYMGALREYHHETYDHCLRVGVLSVDLGIENGMSEEQQRVLGYAGLLHDLGKVCVPLEIIAKQGPLTERERSVIQAHPRLGFLLLHEKRFADVRKIIVAHHEYKEHPYPRTGKKRRAGCVLKRENKERRCNDAAATLAQIVAVADMYDAYSQARVYKPAWPPEQVKEMLTKTFTGDARFITQVLGRSL